MLRIFPVQLRQNEASILLKKKSQCEHVFRTRIVTVQNLEDVCQVLQSFLAAIKTGKFLSTSAVILNSFCVGAKRPVQYGCHQCNIAKTQGVKTQVIGNSIELSIYRSTIPLIFKEISYKNMML